MFDGGLHAAQSAQAHAAYDEQVANYRATVLTAFQDVEDNLAALRQLQRESISQAAAVAATQGALDQANLRYKGGIVTYLEVVPPRTPRCRAARRGGHRDPPRQRHGAARQGTGRRLAAPAAA